MAIKYDDAIAALKLTTQAPKTLAEAGITTIGQLLDRDRDAIAALSGMGTSRLADIDRALDERGLSFGKPLFNPNKYQVCKTCPTCPGCGLPRAVEARNVVVDYRGRYRHANAPGEPCDNCDTYHRQLFATAAAA